MTSPLSLKESLTRGNRSEVAGTRHTSVAVSWDRPSDSSQVLCAASALERRPVVRMELAMQERLAASPPSERRAEKLPMVKPLSIGSREWHWLVLTQQR